MQTGCAGHETQRHATGTLRSGVGKCIALEEGKIQRCNEVPVFRVPAPLGSLGKSPDGVADGALCDHTDVSFLCERQQIIDRVLLKNIERELHDVKIIRFDGVSNPLATSAVAQEANLAGLARLLQRFRNFTGPEYFHCAAVQMNDIQVISFESLETSIDGAVNRR